MTTVSVRLRVLATPGVKLGNSGRSPDVVVRRAPRRGRTVWIDPSDVLLIVEIVSPGSVELDRHLKPLEYARAGVRHFWRVERDGPATVHLFGLGVGSDSESTYIPRTVAVFEDLLAGAVPGLEP